MKTSSQIISNEDLEQKGQIIKTSPLEKWIFCQQEKKTEFILLMNKLRIFLQKFIIRRLNMEFYANEFLQTEMSDILTPEIFLTA